MDFGEQEADRCVSLMEAEINGDTAGQIANMSLEIKDISLLRDALSQIEKPILPMTLRLNQIEDHLDSTQRKQILDWLSFQPTAFKFLIQLPGVQVTSLENADGIRKFVEFETDRPVTKNQLLVYIRQRSTKGELKQLIKEDVISKANGVPSYNCKVFGGFVWKKKDIRSALSKSSRALSELYDDIHERTLENTQETDQAVLRNTLKWMVIGVDKIDEELILDLLSNFVILDMREDGIRPFRFAHPSA
ncbi:hypothetical protein N7532_010506 [Penicillium argentinense]|uniref:Uncharacterized protein n=1 Tax=Penicillium argentinense TaxID=1131581 RepID=A0A9W9EPY9_9EURO|nr:uncharacterized protein N7532_010506 [Penicillium argentinense]KAJ5085735.1 hypothetical protein N7532_010506 [Penicillium argentinense]